MKAATQVIVHSSAFVEENVSLGEGTQVWHQAHVRRGAQLGKGCRIGKGVFIDAGVRIGDYVKIQNYVSVYHGVTIGNGVFVGPHVTFTNDKRPRAVDPSGQPLSVTDWIASPTRVEDGASIGAGAVIVCDITLGRWCMVAAGAVVTRSVPPHALVVGHPARPVAVVDEEGHRVADTYAPGRYVARRGTTFEI